MPWFVAILINVLIAGVIVGAIWYVAKYIAKEMGAGRPVFVFINVVCALAGLIWFLCIVSNTGGRIWVLV